MCNWQFKQNVKQQGSSAGFWYDLTMGGYIDLEAVLKNKEDIIKIKEAVNLLESFEKQLEDEDLLNEF